VPRFLFLLATLIACLGCSPDSEIACNEKFKKGEPFRWVQAASGGQCVRSSVADFSWCMNQVAKNVVLKEQGGNVSLSVGKYNFEVKGDSNNRYAIPQGGSDPVVLAKLERCGLLVQPKVPAKSSRPSEDNPKAELRGIWSGQFRSSKNPGISWTVQLNFLEQRTPVADSICAAVNYYGSMKCEGVLLGCRGRAGTTEAVERIDRGTCTTNGRVSVQRLSEQGSAVWTWLGETGRYQVLLKPGPAPAYDKANSGKSNLAPRPAEKLPRIQGSVKTEPYNKTGYRTYSVWLPVNEGTKGLRKVEYHFDHPGWKGTPEVGSGATFRSRFFAYGCVPKAHALLYYADGRTVRVPFDHCRVTTDLDEL
jgi:hypothetical protein